MSRTINELNTTDTLAGDDKLVIWKDQAGATRAITAADAADYFSLAGGPYQPLDELLTSIAALGPTSTADRIIYTTAQDVAALTPITAFGRTLLSYSTADDVREALLLDAAYVATIAALRALTATTAATAPNAVTVENYASGLIGGGGIWVLDASDTTSADDGGAVIVTAGGLRYKAQWDSEVDVCRFGMHPGASAATNRNAWQACEDYCNAEGGLAYGWSVIDEFSVAKRVSSPTDRAILKRALAKMRGPGTAVGTVSGEKGVTLKPSEDMTLFMADVNVNTRTFTISNASPAVVTAAGHGLSNGQVVYMVTTGTLPTISGTPSALEPVRPYYVINATANTFQIALTPGGTALNTTSAGSGTHTLVYATGAIHSPGISGLNFYGGTTANVQIMLAIASIDAEIENIWVEPGNPALQKHGYLHPSGVSPTWIAYFNRVGVGGFTSGTGLAFYGSDSFLQNLYLSSNAFNMRFSEGSLHIQGALEDGGAGVNNTIGIKVHPGSQAAMGPVVIDCYSIYNEIGVQIDAVPVATNAPIRITGQFRESFAYDIDIGANVAGGTIDSEHDYLGTGGVAHVRWANSGNTGWRVAGTYNLPASTRYSGLPADAQVIAPGFNRVSTFVVSPSTNPVTANGARTELYGSDTVLSETNTAVRIGIAKNSSTFDAALLAGVKNGDQPFLAGRNGETTTASSFGFYFNGTEAMRYTASQITSKVVHSFDSNLVINGTEMMVFVNPANTNRLITWRSSGAARWQVGCNNATEGGTQTGSDFAFYGFSNTGAFLRTHMEMYRENGLTYFGGAVQVDGYLAPQTDNTRTLGASGNRWSTVYAATGTINTSDAREKTPIRPLSEAERRVAAALWGKIGIYQWLEAVARKGDKARLHVGLIAQDVQAAFEAEGLDPWAYGLLCADDIYEEVEVETTREVTHDAGVTQTRTISEIEWIDGEPVITERDIEEPVMETKQARKDGKLVFTETTDDKGVVTTVPVMATRQKVKSETKTETKRKRETVRKLDENGEPLRRLGLRYDQLILFMLSERVTAFLVPALAQSASPTVLPTESEETPMPIGEMEIPEEIEIPRFLAPDPLDGIPDALRALAEPGETIPEMQARLWTLWREMNGKLMLNLASSEEIALHTRLHNELHWIAPPLEGDE